MTATYTQLELARLKRGTENPELNPNNVRPKPCKTCPFGMYGEAIGSELTREEFIAQQTRLIEIALSEGNQYCHADELKGKVSTHVCRGARDIQLRYFTAIGFLKEPTDKAWAEQLNKSRKK